MIQIFTIQNGRTEQRKQLLVSSVEEVFARGTELLEGKLDPSERWNVYYTIAVCDDTLAPGEKERRLVAQNHIPFDVDGIDVPYLPTGEVDEEGLREIARVVLQALDLEWAKTGILFSGNGLQIIVGTTETIEDPDYFKEARPHYAVLCEDVNRALKKAKLKGHVDGSVWSAARLMRFPDTLNVKLKKDPKTKEPVRREVMGILLQPHIERIAYDVTKASKLPEVTQFEQLAENAIVGVMPDVKAIFDPEIGCRFLRWAKEKQNEVSEPQWYAALSITARFPDGHRTSHEISKEYRGYDFDQTQAKSQQAITASGPRRCDNINDLWGKCQESGCPHAVPTIGHDVVSPFLIKSQDHVATEFSGFHLLIPDPTRPTGMRIGPPQFDDLAKVFKREKPYISTAKAGAFWGWTGTHFEEIERDWVLQFAQEKFSPKVKMGQRAEFVEVLRLKKEAMKSVSWFAHSIEGKMNFLNGVLDVATGTLHPHSMEYGFKSVLACNYAPHAEAPRFKKFLDEVTCGDESLQAILQEFSGYIFANGDYRWHKMLMLLGSGSNGKSKFVELIRELAGKGGSSPVSVKDLNNEQHRATLEGKLVNISEENSADSFSNSAVIKNLSAGGEITVKQVYVQPYSFVNRCKLIMLCNEAPNSMDRTEGFYRRFLMVPFNQTFTRAKGNQDPNIMEKLKTELPGIFNWATEGYKRLVKQGGFSYSEASERVLAKYRVDTDSIAAWIEEHITIELDPSLMVVRQELYIDYTQYCQSHGIKELSAIKVYDALRDYLKKNGFVDQDEKPRISGKQVRIFRHIKHDTVKQF